MNGRGIVITSNEDSSLYPVIYYSARVVGY